MSESGVNLQRHGASAVVIVTSHGGPDPSLRDLVDVTDEDILQLYEDLDIPVVLIDQHKYDVINKLRGHVETRLYGATHQVSSSS